MKENSNNEKIQKIFKSNGGFITRNNIDRENIPSWFLYDFIKRNKLIKISPGFYAVESFTIDDYYLLQKRYSKYIFSGLSALYLLGLTDKIPVYKEVSAPQSYNPSRKKIDLLLIHKISNTDIYKYGIKEIKTMFGNIVKVYDEERTICDIIKHRNSFDTETFLKAIKLYISKVNNQAKLFKYARDLGIEKKVFEIMEVVLNAAD